MSLESLLQGNRLWRGGELARDTAALPTGFASLDERLPGGGWPGKGLVELLPRQTGIGELRLLMPVLAKLSRERKRWIAWIAPPYLPYAPALQADGVDLSRVLMVYPRSAEDAFWALEQALRTSTCAAVLGWPQALTARRMRRLQLAAEQGDSLGFLFRPSEASRQSSTAMLRLELDTTAGPPQHPAVARRLNIDILKCRGGWPAGPLSLALARQLPQAVDGPGSR